MTEDVHISVIVYEPGLNHLMPFPTDVFLHNRAAQYLGWAIIHISVELCCDEIIYLDIMMHCYIV